MPRSAGPVRGRDDWLWAFTLFRFGDGTTHALVALMAVIHYGLPIWAVAATAAAMNVAGVPATFLWGALMRNGRGRRRLATTGFALAGLSMLVMATFPPFWAYVLAATAFTAFGVATAPAASVLVLEGRDRLEWPEMTARLSKRMGWAYLAGVVLAIVLAFGGVLDPAAAFASMAVVILLAAVVAWVTIAPHSEIGPIAPVFDAATTRAAQRRFERAVFLPGRLRHAPQWALSASKTPAFRLAAGIGAVIAGSVLFFASYPGVLASDLGLTTGLVLLAQMPSQVATPLTYGAAGRYGRRHGSPHALRLGIQMRLIVLPLLMATIIVLGSKGYLLLLALHAFVGVSFALIQVHAACMVAEMHERGPAHGVGLYHAATAAGTLIGALLATFILLLAPVWASYVVAAVVLFFASRSLLAHLGTTTAIKSATSVQS